MKNFATIIGVLALVFAISCVNGKSSGQSATGNTGSINLKLVFPDRVNANSSGFDNISSASGDATCLECDHVDIVVSGSGMADIPFYDIDYSLHTFLLTNIPAGIGRSIVVNIHNAAHGVMYTGAGSGIDIPAGGESSLLTIELIAADAGDWFVKAPVPSYMPCDGGGDGKSWDTAFCDIQSAVNIAQSGDNIFVARGVYNTGASRTPTVIMRDGINLYGGFAGTERYLSERVLTSEKSYIANYTSHAVIGASNTTIDGFWIYGRSYLPTSAAEDCKSLFLPACFGGGIYNDNVVGMTVRNVLFYGNSAYGGGAMYNGNFSSISIEDSFFISNYGYTMFDVSNNYLDHGVGGALYNDNSFVDINNCVFDGNQSLEAGGAIYNNWSVLNISDSVFINNAQFTDPDTITPTIDAKGGGVMFNLVSAVTFTNTEIAHNWALEGSVIYNDSASQVFFEKSYISSNLGASYIFNNGTVFLVNSIAMENSEIENMATLGMQFSTFYLNDKIILDQFNSEEQVVNFFAWGNIFWLNDIVSVDPVFGLEAWVRITDYYNDTDPTMFDGILPGNDYRVTGSFSTDPLFRSDFQNLQITGAWTDVQITCDEINLDSIITPFYCITYLTDNTKNWVPSSLNGSFVYNSDSSLILDNTTNTIIISGDHTKDISTLGGAGLTWKISIGDTYEVIDFHLQPGSPCIDIFDPDAYSWDASKDIEGNPRATGTLWDIGAYEIVP